MQEFIAIDFETGNPKRVSACALGYAKVEKAETPPSFEPNPLARIRCQALESYHLPLGSHLGPGPGTSPGRIIQTTVLPSMNSSSNVMPVR